MLMAVLPNTDSGVTPYQSIEPAIAALMGFIILSQHLVFREIGAIAAIVARNAQSLGASMNECMRCWEAILPHVVRHPTLAVDLVALLVFGMNLSEIPHQTLS